jgi:hypothetical protein
MNVSLVGTVGITIAVDARCRGTQYIASILYFWKGKAAV